MLKAKHKTFQETLQTLCKQSHKRPMTVAEILAILSQKGNSLVLIFLALPFCQPLQIPGLSTPFGLIIACIGLRISLHRDTTWLPRFLLVKHISHGKIQKITSLSLKVIHKIRFFIRPRLTWVCQHRVMSTVNGLVICLLGIFLALPLPIPLTNLAAAWCILLISLGVLEDDGILVLVGHLVLLTLVIFFICIFWFLRYEVIK